MLEPATAKTLGWQPTCLCGMTETASCVVLDPFAGSGTTGAVARSMGRSSILIELNPEYVNLIRERCSTDHVALETFAEVTNAPVREAKEQAEHWKRHLELHKKASSNQENNVKDGE